MITSLKISLIARARSSVSGRLQMMMPPKGACLSVANAFSHASRKIGVGADAAGVGVLENRNGRLRKFVDEFRGGGNVQDVVEGEFLAVQFLKILVQFPVERRLLVRVLAVTKPPGVRKAEGKMRRSSPAPC